MNLHTYIPYNVDGNLGKAYNDFMKMVDDDDWVCFLDADAMFTTRNYYTYMLETIETNPDYGLFTTMTNRVRFDSYQLFKDVSRENHDISYHRKVGIEKNNKYYNVVINLNSLSIPHLLSGVVLLLSKETWKAVGGFCDGFLGVDNDVHKRCRNHKIGVGLLKGLYVYHWYRADGKAHIDEVTRKQRQLN